MKIRKIILTLFALLVMCFAVCACTATTSGKIYSTINYFGAELVVTVYDDFSNDDKVAQYEDDIEAIDALASEIDASISLSYDDSYVSRFNSAAAGETTQIDKHTYDIMSLAKEYTAVTDGAFDPAVYLLVDLWGFSSRFNDISSDYSAVYDREDYASELPDEKYIDAFTEVTGFDKVELSSEGGSYYVIKPSVTAEVDGEEYTMQIDLGGVGKGYVADLIAEELITMGYTSGYVSVGQSSLRMLDYPYDTQENWEVGVKNPYDDDYKYVSINCNNIGIGTSGDYQRSYEIDSVTYSHIIDPTTGWPTAQGIDIATTLTPMASMADAYSTALCVLGDDFCDTAAGEGCEYIYTSNYNVNTNISSDGYTILDGEFYVTK